MPGKRHSEKQIVYALRQVEGGKKVSETCREMGGVAGGGLHLEAAIQHLEISLQS